MAQGIFAGGTNYSNQSIDDIKKDLLCWMSSCDSMRKLFETTIDELSTSKYWQDNVPFDFRMFCLNTITTTETFRSDLAHIVAAIDKNQITSHEITLLKNIYMVSKEEEQESKMAFKNSNNGYWQEYDRDEFKKTELLYQKGRDFYVMLFDADNMLPRLEQYRTEAVGANKTIIADHSVVIGDGNIIDKSKLNAGKPDKKPWFVEHFWAPLIVAVIAGIIIWVITK